MQEKLKDRKYEKPKITKIDLRPEEAVLGNCKMSSVSGPLRSSCTTAGGCSTPGT
jgi:hypothetical protein